MDALLLLLLLLIKGRKKRRGFRLVLLFRICRRRRQRRRRHTADREIKGNQTRTKSERESERDATTKEKPWEPFDSVSYTQVWSLSSSSSSTTRVSRVMNGQMGASHVTHSVICRPLAFFVLSLVAALTKKEQRKGICFVREYLLLLFLLKDKNTQGEEEEEDGGFRKRDLDVYPSLVFSRRRRRHQPTTAATHSKTDTNLTVPFFTISHFLNVLRNIILNNCHCAFTFLYFNLNL